MLWCRSVWEGQGGGALPKFCQIFNMIGWFCGVRLYMYMYLGCRATKLFVPCIPWRSWRSLMITDLDCFSRTPHWTRGGGHRAFKPISHFHFWEAAAQLPVLSVTCKTSHRWYTGRVTTNSMSVFLLPFNSSHSSPSNNPHWVQAGKRGRHLYHRRYPRPATVIGYQKNTV